MAGVYRLIEHYSGIKYFNEKRVRNEFTIINISLETNNEQSEAGVIYDGFRRKGNYIGLRGVVRALMASPIYHRVEDKVWEMYPEVFSLLEERIRTRGLEPPVRPRDLCTCLKEVAKILAES